MVRIGKGMWTIGIPVILSAMSVIRHSIPLFVCFVVAHFLILKMTPVFKHNENIWMFIIVAISSIPVNIYVLNVLNDWAMIFSSFLLLNVLRGVLYYILLLSVEEVIMGTLARWIWKKQYKIKIF